MDGPEAAAPGTLCPLCDRPVRSLKRLPDCDVAQVTCDRCGSFEITKEADEALDKEDRKYLLSATCRAWAAPGVPRILTTNLEALIRQAPRLSVSEQLDGILDLIARKSWSMDSWSTFSPEIDYPLLAVRSVNELLFLIHKLERSGHVRRKPPDLSVTVEGLQRLEVVQQSGKASALAFVAMWFDERTAALYDSAIQPAIRQAGYEPIRIDRREHSNRIDDEIVSQIRKARFMVADFTGQRPGVYFEAGMMTGLGRQVIWMCDKAELGALHFDVRQYNFIDWTSLEEAGTRLRFRILATEGQGPHEADAAQTKN